MGGVEAPRGEAVQDVSGQQVAAPADSAAIAAAAGTEIEPPGRGLLIESPDDDGWGW